MRRLFITMQLTQLKANLKSIDFEVIVGDALEKHKQKVIDYQQLQMLEGKKADGTQIGKYKNQYYANKKFMMNSLAGWGNVDLRLTNEFQRNINVRFFSKSMIIFSTDSKMETLVDKYGPDIFGLNAEFIIEFGNAFLNFEISQLIQNKIYGL